MQSDSKDVAILVIGVVLGCLPWLLDKLGVELPKYVYFALLICSVVAIGWSLISLEWLTELPFLSGRSNSVATTGIMCACAALLAVILYAALHPWPATFKPFADEVILGKTFENQVVDIDGKRFDRCIFRNVTLFYHGTGGGDFINVKFEGTVALQTDNEPAKGFLKLVEIVRGVAGARPVFVGDKDIKTGVITPLKPQ